MSDREVEAIAAISNTFSQLDEETRSRVLRWAVERYGTATPVAPVSAWQAGAANGSSGVPGENGAQAIAEITDASRPIINATVVPSGFEHFAELFDAVRPDSVSDKALAAAYWEQVVEGSESWPSAVINKRLKDMGHGVPAINKALDAAMSRRPALVIQLKKSGSSQQGRKLYKLTTEGIRYVQSRIESGQ
jgi:hypothetical protein